MGIIINTNKGIIHKSGRGFYSGAIAESGVMPASTVKRGRGRPRKNSGESGAAYDFSALVGKVKIPKWKGPSMVVVKFEE